MGDNPKDAIKNENLAPKIVKKTLVTITRLLSFVGKPLYIILILLASITLPIIQTFKFLIKKLKNSKTEKQKNYFKFFKTIFPFRKSRIIHKKGIIYRSSQLNFHLFKKRFTKKISLVANLLSKQQLKLPKGIENLIWDSEVFILAVRKLVSKLKIWENLFLIPLKLKLILIRSFSIIPKPIFPKISKVKMALFFLTCLFVISFTAGVLFWFYILKDLPSPTRLTQRKFAVSTKIYDRNGILLYTIFKDQNRTPIPLEEIPKQVRLATIAVEDAEFYNHPGFSIKGVVRSLIKNFRERQLSGGSTITQQLVKNALLSPEKTLVRKLKEVVLAINVELTFSKDQILEMYLNEVAYGGTAYGIQEAARFYFDKDAKNLSLAEAALLAGLPKSPTTFSPFGTNPEKAVERQKEVLKLMSVNGFITEEQRSAAENAQLKFAENRTPIIAPHFVFYVKEELEARYGKELVESGGLEVITTLDYKIQKLAEEVVSQEVEKLKNLNVSNAAAVVLNPKTGEILAMVGSKDYFDTEHDGNVNVAVRPRQPGSSIKIVNYAYALSNGLTPASLVNDSPMTFYVDGQPPYTPKNYEGGYRGTLTIRNALAESRNIPAVKVLASYGVAKMLEMGEKMGITTWDNPSNYGLSLTLGGGEVILIDLARAYATIASYGMRPNLVSVLKVTDYNEKVLEEFKCEKIQVEQVPQVVKVKDQTDQLLAETNKQINEVAAATKSALFENSPNLKNCGGEQVLDPRVAFIITDILKDNNARAPSFGTNSLLVIPKHPEVAVKTGTSNDLRDNLAIGYNQDYLVAIWVGNNDNSPMARIASGVTGATPIWNKIMSALLTEGINLTTASSQEPSSGWQIPEGIVQLPICPYTGTLACEGCPVKQEWFLEENKPVQACSPEWFKKAESPEPVEGKEDEQAITPIPETQYIGPQQFIDRLLQERFGKKKKSKD